MGRAPGRETMALKPVARLLTVVSGAVLVTTVTAQDCPNCDPPWAEPEANFDAVAAVYGIEVTLSNLSIPMSIMIEGFGSAAQAHLFSNPRLALLDEVSMGLVSVVVDEIFAFLDLLAQEGASLPLVDRYVTRALAVGTTSTCSTAVRLASSAS